MLGSGIVPSDMIQWIHVSGYRSVRELDLELQPINVLTGPNGCGKSNLYNSLVLIGRAAQGQLAHAIAEEGGTPRFFGLEASGFGIRERSLPSELSSDLKEQSSLMSSRSDFPDLMNTPWEHCSSSILA